MTSTEAAAAAAALLAHPAFAAADEEWKRRAWMNVGVVFQERFVLTRDPADLDRASRCGSRPLPVPRPTTPRCPAA